MTNMTVPVEEVQRFAIKTWQSPNSVGAQIQNVTYFDLETGRIVTGNTVYDWNRALTYFNYTILLPNIVDSLPAQDAAAQLHSQQPHNWTDNSQPIMSIINPAAKGSQ